MFSSIIFPELLKLPVFISWNVSPCEYSPILSAALTVQFKNKLLPSSLREQYYTTAFFLIERAKMNQVCTRIESITHRNYLCFLKKMQNIFPWFLNTNHKSCHLWKPWNNEKMSIEHFQSFTVVISIGFSKNLTEIVKLSL